MAGHSSDTEYTPTVFWEKDGQRYTEQVSAYGEVSAGEEEDPEDLYGEDGGACPGNISIEGDIVRRLGALRVFFLFCLTNHLSSSSNVPMESSRRCTSTQTTKQREM